MLKEDCKNIKILYIEDDDITRENAIEYLENFFDEVYEASNAIEALGIYEKTNPHIIISDIQMPKLNGLEFVEKIRQKDKKVQIIITSAFSNKEYLLKAIELQLVKYLIKPINENELEKALDSCVHSIKSDSSNIIKLTDELFFDTFNSTLVQNGDIVKLRAKEIDFLTLLLKNKNRYVKYEEIESYVWKDSVMSKDALKTLVKNIKTKIPKELILNLSGSGYKIEL